MKELIARNSAFNFEAVFKSAPDLYLILSPELYIIEVNDAYLKATMVHREAIIGRHIFDVFPDNPNDPTADGTKNLHASLLRVLELKVPDTMAVQKYDIRRPESEGGGFEERYWSPINAPVLDEKQAVKYIIHRVEDVTEFIQLKQSASQQRKLTEELLSRAGKMEADIYQRAQEIQAANEKLRTLNEELAKKKEEQEVLYNKLENLSNLKSQFFANISHELRTPLTLILGPLEKLWANEDLKPYQSDLTLIQDNARILLRLINDLLDIAKLEAGKMTVNYVRYDLGKQGRQIIALFQSHAEMRGIDFSFECPENLAIEADPEKIQRILINLLSNAFKYTPSDGKVGCSISHSAGKAKIVISDSGPGIPAELRQAIFERFFRVENPSFVKVGGFGLGLAIVKDFIEMHGGRITVGSSARHKGAEFTISLPLKAPATATVYSELILSRPLENEQTPSLPDILQLRELTVKKSSGAKKAKKETDTPNQPLILVIEDNNDLNEHICEILASDYRTASAFDGREGLEKAQALRPDLILSDLMMPRLNGLQLLEALRKDAKMDKIPVIILTAKADEELSVKLLSEGAQDYLAKPFSQAELKVRVKNLVGLKRATEALADKNAALINANEELEAFSYTVSHDLRNPLSAILGYGTLLSERSDLTLEEKDYLQEILKAVKNMNELVVDLLNFSHSTSGELKCQAVNLSELVKEIASDLKKQDPSRVVRFKIKDKVTAACDAHLIKIVLQNLLNNAWKFNSKNKEAHIEFGVLEEGGPVYYIRDNGVGFPAEKADKLFLPFSRLHTSKDFMGTGIGLATVKRIIIRHQGKVWAESQVGEGATFYLKF
jgi:signal transduction histidine kinase